ncbi:MAG: 2-hydroxyacyl-CoA dehydratase [Deltaproteobacteria bacterium]|nr:MAG: 2-hydroxyacyl-CoA dehydratase [Deltaproteobacteria bacterium]
MSNDLDFRALTGGIDNPFVADWKKEGRPVAGYFCSHAPEELLTAAGALAIRMRGSGSESTARADAFLGSVNCSFVRHTLDRLLAGDLEFLDAVVVTNSCDHIRRIYDILHTKNVVPLPLYLDVPHVRGEDALGRLVAQLEAMKTALEGAFGVSISNEDLREAIALHNRTRRLLARAAELRSSRPDRLSGSDLLAFAVASASVPRALFNEALEERLDAIERSSAGAETAPGGNGAGPQGPRLMLVGGILDDPSYVEVFEDLGASIVADALCCCSKTFSVLADEDGDPLEAIARRLLDHVPCPRMVADYQTRLDDILSAVERHRVDAVVCERLKFCDLWAGETKMLARSLREERGIPLLVLEREYLTQSGIGQMRTRVQAFLESLG